MTTKSVKLIEILLDHQIKALYERGLLQLGAKLGEPSPLRPSFLDASIHLYMRLRWFVRQSVCPSVMNFSEIAKTVRKL